MLPASGGATASVGLSPFLDLDVSGVEWRCDPVTGYWKPGGKAIDTATAYRAAFPIELTSPDVFKRPDTLGDGGNQFVYGGQQPDGYLYVPGAITVTGGDQSDAQWLVDNNKIDMKVEDSTIGGVFTHGWAVAGSQILLDTTYTDENGMQAYSYGWVFKGLPAFNSGFGNHEVNLYVDGTLSETAHIQTFFSGGSSNFPGSDGYTPNWFHYYAQAYVLSGPDIVGYSYNASLPSRGATFFQFIRGSSNPPYNYRIDIGPGAARDDTVPAFAIDTAPPYHVENVGELSIKGIHSYIRVVAHEEAHAYLAKHGIYVPYYREDGPPAGILDKDSDGIPDDWERNHHLDYDNPDTTNYFSSTTIGTVDEGREDAELLCEIRALGELKANKLLWQQDWADFGLQYGRRPMLFPWSYFGDAGISTSIPDDVLGGLP